MTDEKQSTVDAWYAKAQPKYPIAILKNKDFENALGVRFFPTAGVIAPDGKLIYAGSAGSKDSPLKEALSDAVKAPLFPSKLSKVQSQLAEGDLEKAWAEVVKLQEKAGGDAELDRWTERFAETISAEALQSFEQAKARAADGLYYQAVELVEPLVEAKTPFPVSEQAGEWLRQLEAEPSYDDEIKAGGMHAKAVESEQEGEYTDACKAYIKVAKKYPDTRLAEAALERAQTLVDRGWPGYDGDCKACKSAKRACKKHEDTVKF